MTPVRMTVELVHFFGHEGLLLRVPGQPTVMVSLADPQGKDELVRQMTRIASQGVEGKENP